MPHSEKSQKAFMYLGMVVWFILRWSFYIFLFYVAFTLGGKQGPVKERVKQLQFPKIQIQFPASSPQISTVMQPKVDSYVILIGSFKDLTSAHSLQNQLNRARINNYVISTNGEFHVCVGKFRTRGRAQSILKRIKEKGFPNARIISPSALSAEQE